MKTREEYERLIAGCTADIEDADDLVRRLCAERCRYNREMRALPYQAAGSSALDAMQAYAKAPLQEAEAEEEQPC
jgi:hypothetical protein